MSFPKGSWLCGTQIVRTGYEQAMRRVCVEQGLQSARAHSRRSHVITCCQLSGRVFHAMRTAQSSLYGMNGFNICASACFAIIPKPGSASKGSLSWLSLAFPPNRCAGCKIGRIHPHNRGAAKLGARDAFGAFGIPWGSHGCGSPNAPIP